MFSKPSAKAAPRAGRPAPGELSAAAALKRGGPQQCSLLASDLTVVGDIVGDGELLLEGQVKGDIRVSRLIIGKQAEVVGRIEADTVDIRGRVQGDVAAKVVRLLETAHVDGDILHETLSIDSGAFYRGRVEQREADPLELADKPHRTAPRGAGAGADPAGPLPALDPLPLQGGRPLPVRAPPGAQGSEPDETATGQSPPETGQGAAPSLRGSDDLAEPLALGPGPPTVSRRRL